MHHPKVFALGEIGLDYSGDHHRHKLTQQVVFKRLLGLAVEKDKPVIIHCREAEEDCLRIALDTLPTHWKIHLHCYTGDWEGARASAPA